MNNTDKSICSYMFVYTQTYVTRCYKGTEQVTKGNTCTTSLNVPALQCPPPLSSLMLR